MSFDISLAFDIWARQWKNHKGRVENGGKDRNSLVCSPGEHMGMVLMEVLKYRGGASTAGYEHLVAVHAARLPGGLVVICFLEVIPRYTFCAGGE